MLVALHCNFFLCVQFLPQNAVCFGIGQLFNKLAKEIGSPVDFELPESFNKWKPTSSYSTIRRSMPLTS